MSENQQKTMVQEVPLTDDMFERIGTEGLRVKILVNNPLHTGQMFGEDFVPTKWQF